MTRSAGVTLVELLLVLVLLVVIGSLAAPTLTGGFDSVRLRRGTDQVLAAWTKARTGAIESGQVFQFRLTKETGTYRVGPWDESEEDSPEFLAAELNPLEATNGNELGSEWPLEATLPEGIVFVASEQLVDLASEEGSRRVDPLSESRSSGWSAPILFYPDGTTSAAAVILRNERKQFQRATLRSLTGVARASGLLSEDEVQRQR